MILSSIRWRLQVWHAALLTAVVAAFGYTAHHFEVAEEMRRVDAELQGRLLRLESLVPPPDPRTVAAAGNRRPPPPPPRGDAADLFFDPLFIERGPPPFPPERADLPPGPDNRLPLIAGAPPRQGRVIENAMADKYYFVVWHYDGNVQARSPNLPADLKMPELNAENHEPQMRMSGMNREFFQFTAEDRCLLVGRSIEGELANQQRYSWFLAGVGSGVLALGLLGGWWASRRAIRPIEEISATAEKIAAGDLSQRISSEGFADELQNLAGVLNSTFARLEAAFSQQARFTADAAHELRTPVTVMLTHTQNGLASENLSGEEREAFEACQRAAQRMRRLIESLLELARFDAGQQVLGREVFDLAQATRDCLVLVEPLAETRGVQIQSDLHAALCTGDSDRIAQVITNLLTNAIQYTRDRGAVHISTQAYGGSALLVVADNGPGIAKEDLPHVFERFYRGDAARSSTRRSGLGLAISKSIVETHGGSLTVESPPGKGTAFSMRLPLSTISQRLH